MPYSRPQLKLLLVLAVTLLAGFGVREWRAGFPDMAERLQHFDREAPAAPPLPAPPAQPPRTPAPRAAPPAGAPRRARPRRRPPRSAHHLRPGAPGRCRWHPPIRAPSTS